MVDSKAKGNRGEYQVRDLMRQYTGLQWERTPASGALTYLKGDLYIPNTPQKFVVEVKNYKESPLSDKVLTSTTNNLNQWWSKLVHQANTMEPLLFWKYDRSKWFVGTRKQPTTLKKYLYMHPNVCYIMIAEEFLKEEWKNYV